MKHFLLLFCLFLSCYTSKKPTIPDYLALLHEGKTIRVNILGDSLSQRSRAFGLQDKLGSSYLVFDYSVEGRNVRDWFFDVNVVLQSRADIILIELGTNDAMSLSSEEYKYYILELIQYIQKRSSAKLVLSTAPLSNMQSLWDVIRTNNSFIRSLRTDHTIIELENVLIDKEGFSFYPLDDPIHPYPAGYEVLGEVLRKELLSLR